MARFIVMLVAGLLLASAWAAEPIADPALLALLRAAPSAADLPDEDAVWLLRDLEVEWAADGATTVRERVLLKLLTPRALGAAQWEIPYDTATETLELRVARTLLHDTAYTVDPTLVVEQPLHPGAAWYSSAVARRFPLPMARPGAVLEVSTTYRRAAPRMAGSLCARLPLQFGYPVRRADVRLRVPEGQRLTIRFRGAQQIEPAEGVADGWRSYAWTGRHVPALRILEPNAPPAEDLADMAVVSSLTSWAPVAAWFADLTRDKDTVTGPLGRAATTLTQDCRSATEQATVLYDAVRDLPYVGVEFGRLRDEPHTADAVYHAGHGDCKDKATLLRALLRAVNIESQYVLVRTAERGRLAAEACGPDEFNHVILCAELPDGLIYMDPSVMHAPLGVLSPEVAGADALRIRGDGEMLTLPTPGPEANRADVRVTVTVAADGSATGRAELVYTGQTALLQRMLLGPVPRGREREALAESLQPVLGHEAALDGVLIDGLHDPARPLRLVVTFSSPAYLQAAGAAQSLALPTLMAQANPYRGYRTRTLPVRQTTAGAIHLETTVTLPARYTVTAQPAAVEVAGPAGRFADRVTVDGRTVRYTGDLTLQRGVFPPESYPEVRALAAALALEGRNGLQVFVQAAE